MSEEAQAQMRPLLLPDEIDKTEVYPFVHMIKADVTHFIDTSLTYDALTAPDLTYTLVRPLEDKYNAIQREGNMSIVFCFLLNRVHFLRDQNLTTSGISRTRAALCEILAMRTLRANAESTLQLALALTTSWPVYNGADPRVIQQAREERDDDLDDRVGNAIEMAIISKAKRFIKSSACQKVINGIWSGKCVYQAESSHTILSDTYKRTPIHFYDPHKAPLLDHYRLKVPAVRSVLEYMNFVVLFILFVVALEFSERKTINTPEIVFMVYALGFALEKVAALQEHGMKVYVTGTWNGFDLAFVTIYCTYASLRLYGVVHDSKWARRAGMDCLAMIAPLMFPRLAFVTLRNNLMVLSLRAMLVQFTALMFIAAFCFGGFLYALWTLSRDSAGYSGGQIAWWMLDLWFGLDASGFELAFKFHPFFGPVLMVTYACLSNTLLLTVLVSILSHTFSTISEDALAEAMFRKAVATIEGVKADPLFSYQPPINLVALLIMLPASYILSPRWFHKLNVFMIRITNFPILLTVAWYERQAKNTGSTGFYETVAATVEKIYDTLPRQIRRLTFFEGLAGSGGDIDAVFDIEEDMNSALSETEELSGFLPSTSISTARKQSSSSQKRQSISENPAAPRSEASPGNRKEDLPGPSTPAPRPRLMSISRVMADTTGQMPSPLAQIYQPLPVDDSILEDESGPPPVVGSPALSFGPVTRRRRLSSRVQPRLPSDGRGGLGVHVRKTSTGSSPGMRHRPLAEDTQTVSQSPDQMPWPETAGQVEEEEGERGNGSLPWIRRLENIEKRQERIEELLLQLTRRKDL
ncbi:hypothetical protein PUNSTDRAFT_127492 [Punctularia strigosozonata HHB-11173 SS5]|uniref:uncharacterized protein n=1 Tax=Punctularia strigosozonata (strain HHB-11173) TaxID=741275 RepID=UPI00044165C2|nr:uncharacterized protein PUNSTDRAFT_127492 [Punctularia strigosozonata HHB-11173 SS5]EIN06002.1 hypothetical protein PUNSTDRAFT_127492 [Punctularia strigosozonata HHB-11173 SS5]